MNLAITFTALRELTQKSTANSKLFNICSYKVNQNGLANRTTRVNCRQWEAVILQKRLSIELYYKESCPVIHYLLKPTSHKSI